MFICLLTKGHGFLEALSLIMPFAEKQTIKMYTLDKQAVVVGGHLALVGQCAGHSSRQEHWSKSAQIRTINRGCLHCRQGLEEATHTRLCLHTILSRAHCQVGGSLGILSWR